MCGDLSGDMQSEEGWAEKGDVETLETAVPASWWIRHLFASVPTIVKVRVWVMAAPSNRQVVKG